MSENLDSVTALLTDHYAAFNRRDVPFLLAEMTPDVAWPNGWEGGTVHGRAEVGGYWRRRWEEIDPTVTPTGSRSSPTGRRRPRSGRGRSRGGHRRPVGLGRSAEGPEDGAVAPLGHWLIGVGLAGFVVRWSP